MGQLSRFDSSLPYGIKGLRLVLPITKKTGRHRSWDWHRLTDAGLFAFSGKLITEQGLMTTDRGVGSWSCSLQNVHSQVLSVHRSCQRYKCEGAGVLVALFPIQLIAALQSRQASCTALYELDAFLLCL